MADVKISELTALTTPDGAEELVVNDSGTTKKITITNATSASLPKAGGTMTGVIAGFESTGIDDNATSTAITIDASENVGIGVVPEAWYSGFTALQLSDTGAIYSENVGGESSIVVAENAYIATDGSSKYLTTDEASLYQQNNGTHAFKVAASGTADSAISWTTAMTIDNSGSVGIGTSSPTGNLDVTGTANSTVSITAAGTGNDSLLNFVQGSSIEGGITYDHNSSYASEKMIFRAGNNTSQMTITGSGNVGIGTSSPSDNLHLAESGATSSFIRFSNSNVSNGWSLGAGTNGRFQLTQNLVADRLIVDSSGNVLVGKTSSTSSTVGVESSASGRIMATRSGGISALFNRTGSHGDIVDFRKDNTSVGSIGSVGGALFTGSAESNLRFNYGAGQAVIPATSTGAVRDNVIDLGQGSARFDDIYATNGTIQTSDRNEKQDILAITTAESNVATACKGLLRSFRWKDAVAEKGDDARIHFGIIAQDLQDAFTAEGLDAGRYAMFISSTWWETQTEVPAVLAEEAVYEDVVVTPAQEAGFREVTPAVQAEPAYYDVDGSVIKEAVEASEAVHEATEAVAEVTESRIATEAVEAKDAYTRTDTFETLEEAPEGATERTRLGVRYPELLSFIIAAL